ncbi:GrpB-like predicted nucleotidyltransferase (UPF0157 family) [Inhella inkyongensis]|uniref:GrpB-like predicted nucleotidyltransferase (UPF0157 family) n=1 Tax=Inhella inkyongensis TaxID=392593 RepID=A0A840S5D7_9BURK|nr:GrpB family protein [Inhella inkyongensis]MBB5204236.1 GrpB-like predicted nucleotidyltransferase (UPF0157 family) [Inhella inkyongensis]
MNLPAFARSRRIEIVGPLARWPEEHVHWRARLRGLLPEPAFEIESIGSTAVPGLAAKDVIDLQLGVPSLDGALPWRERLWAAGWQRGREWVMDEGAAPGRKLYFREPEGERRVHLHVREIGSANHRFALLMRDYLCAQPEAAVQYEQIKRRAAALFPEQVDGYLWLKEPVFQLIGLAAEQWAVRVGWRSA